MAIRGVSLAERHHFILSDDPAHPKNIEAEIARRTAKEADADKRQAIADKVRADAGEPTVFELANLLQEDRVLLGDMIPGIEQLKNGSMRMQAKATHKAYETVRRGLRGWDNFLGGDGVAFAFTTEPGYGERGQPRSFVSDASLLCLTHDQMREISEEILLINGVSSDQEKKFADALRQSADVASTDGHVEAAPSETKD